MLVQYLKRGRRLAGAVGQGSLSNCTAVRTAPASSIASKNSSRSDNEPFEVELGSASTVTKENHQKKVAKPSSPFTNDDFDPFLDSKTIHDKLNRVFHDNSITKSQKIIFFRRWVDDLMKQNRIELVGSIVNKFDQKIWKKENPLNFIFRSDEEYWQLLFELINRRQHLSSGLLLTKILDLDLKITPDRNMVDIVTKNLLFVEGGHTGISLTLQIISRLASSKKLYLLSHDLCDNFFKNLAKISVGYDASDRKDIENSISKCFTILENKYIAVDQDCFSTMKLLVLVSYHFNLEAVAENFLARYCSLLKTRAKVGMNAEGSLSLSQQRKLADRSSALFGSFGSANKALLHSRSSGESTSSINVKLRSDAEKIGNQRLHSFNFQVLAHLFDLKHFYIENTSEDSRDVNSMLDFMDIIARQIFFCHKLGGPPLSHLYFNNNHPSSFNDNITNTDRELKELRSIVSQQTPLSESDTTRLSNFSDYFRLKYGTTKKIVSEEAAAVGAAIDATKENAPSTSSSSSASSLNVSTLFQVYRNVASFLCDKGAHVVYLMPSGSHERHLIRTVAEELGLKHFFVHKGSKKVAQSSENPSKSLNDSSSDRRIVFDAAFDPVDGMVKLVKHPVPIFQAYKNSVNHYDFNAIKIPETLQDMLLSDSFNSEISKKFDVFLPFWQELSETLGSALKSATQNEKSLSSTPDVVHIIQNAALRCVSFPNGVYSCQWTFLWTDFLIQNQIPFPIGLLSHTLEHSIRRSDIFGTIETLYLSICETRRWKDPKNSLVWSKNKWNRGVADKLDKAEWGKATEVLVSVLKSQEKTSYKHDWIRTELDYLAHENVSGENDIRALKARLHYESLLNPRSNRSLHLLQKIYRHDANKNISLDTRVIEDLARVLLSHFKSSSGESGDAAKDSDFIFEQNFDQGLEGRPFYNLNSNMKHPSYIDELINKVEALENTWCKDVSNASNRKNTLKKQFISRNAYFSKFLQFHRVHANNFSGKMRMHLFILRNLQSNNQVLNSIKYGPLKSEYEEVFCKLLVYSCFQIMDLSQQFKIRTVPSSEENQAENNSNNKNCSSSSRSAEILSKSSNQAISTSSPDDSISPNYEAVSNSNLALVFTSLYKFFKIYLLK